MTKPLLYFFIKLITSILVFLLFHVAASAQDAYVGIESDFFTKKNNPVERTNNNGFAEINNFAVGSFVGGTYSFFISKPSRCFRRYNNYTLMNIGMGQSKINFQNELYGFFSSSQQYGAIRINGIFNYWSFPFSITHCVKGNSFKLSYIPCFINGTSYKTLAFGGAIGSIEAVVYPDISSAFQHSFRVSYAKNFFLFKNGLLCSVAPFAGIGNSYFNYDGKRFDILSYGINLSLQLRFHLPEVSVNVYHDNTEYKRRKKEEELKMKQEEIENKLKNKPQ